MSSEMTQVLSALERLTDGSLTLRTAEDEHTIVAAYELDGRLVAHGWPKWKMADYLGRAREEAEDGVRVLLAKGNSRKALPSQCDDQRPATTSPAVSQQRPQQSQATAHT